MKICAQCGGTLEPGLATAHGLVGSGAIEEQTKPRLVFVVSGNPTSANPIKAFAQGLAGERPNQVYGITGFRCSQCGSLELYAAEPAQE